MSDELLQYFGLQLARYLKLPTPLPQVQNAILNVIADLREAGKLGPPARESLPQLRSLGPLAGKRVELVFVHDCRNQGCNISQCVLCKHNPNKRCTENFANKYWVGDKLLAKCEGEISVELVDASGAPVTEDLSSFRIEVCILDGNRYNTKCREAGEQKLEILDDCEVLLNQKMEPLLYSSTANNTKEHPSVVLKFQPGSSLVPLREVKVTESSESVLAGTKRPPFRLVVRAIHENGERLHIRPAVSEEFVVVTKRTKNLKKQEIPSLDDPIAKLNHVGKETVKKLNELKASADEVQMELNLPHDLDKVMKVKDFLKLTRMSEADGHLQQKLKALLKLSKEKWEAACEHAKTAVQTDNRMRAWYSSNMSVGLLYTCSLGEVRPDCPVALLQTRQPEGGEEYTEVIPMEHQLPAQREQVQAIGDQAMKKWWEDTHPGWMIFTLGNKHFETLDQIIQYSQGSNRLEPIRRMHQQRDDSSIPGYRESTENLDDSINSDPSEVKGRREVRRGRPIPAMEGERSQNDSPQQSGPEHMFGGADTYHRHDLAQAQDQRWSDADGEEGRRVGVDDFNPFRSRMHAGYPPALGSLRLPDDGRWPPGVVDGAGFPPGPRNWPPMMPGNSFPPDMLNSMMSMNGGFPELGSFPSLGMFSKSGAPNLSLLFNDGQPDPKLMFSNSIQSPPPHMAGLMKRKASDMEVHPHDRSPDDHQPTMISRASE